MTSSLAAASYVILAELAAAYFYLYSLYRRPYFVWMALGWGCNVAYVSAEAWAGYPLTSNVRAMLTGVNALSLVPFYLAAIDLRRVVVRARRYILGGVLVVVVASVLLLGWMPSAGAWLEPVLLSVIAVTFAVPLVMLTQSFATAQGGEILRILRNQPNTAALYGTRGDVDEAESSPDVTRLLGWTQTLLVISCSVYAIVQVCYPLAVANRWTGAQTYLIVFGIALLTKILHGLALPIWLLADLRERLKVLSQRSIAEELGTLAAALEHDVRSALAVLWKELENTRRRYQHDSALMTRLQRLSQCAERISAATSVIPISREITSDFLDLATPVNIVAVIRAAADAVKHTDRAGDLVVPIESDKNEIMVRGDRARLTQAFVNLINNGVDASRSKGKARPRVTIRCSSAKSPGAVTIVVHDDGTGVPEDVLRRLTKPFFTTKAGAGRNRGIGLFVTARVIRIHSGTMSFDTDGHSYTDVTVTLPIVMNKNPDKAA